MQFEKYYNYMLGETEKVYFNTSLIWTGKLTQKRIELHR